jgi:uncharacterized membrane protein SpoIIM required for sporulation
MIENPEGSSNINADLLADLFVRLTDDLSYSKTHYPNSNTTKYLNSLASRVHQAIYKNKKEKTSRFKTYWKYELPLLFKNSHTHLLYAFIIFSVSFALGILSSIYDENFFRTVMRFLLGPFWGDAYVNQTLENIKNGDPMAIYKDQQSLEMFFQIAFNNIKVAFIGFACGMLFSFGSGFFLFINGIMVGAFQYFFYERGLFVESASVIWIHGTIEIFSIIVGGCAGLVLGNSIMFPKTYSRLVSFMNGAKQGIKIIIGIIPFIVFAAFFESFVTRHTEMPLAVKLMIIFGSLLFMIWYFIIYPIYLNKKFANAV